MHYRHADELPRVQDTFQTLEDDRSSLHNLLVRLNGICQEIASLDEKHGIYIFSEIKNELNYFKPDDNLDIDKLMKLADSRFWDMCLNISDIERFVTMSEKEKMRSDFREKPPAYSAQDARVLVKKIESSSSSIGLSTVKKVFLQLTDVRFLPGHERDRTKTKHHNRKMIQQSFRYSWLGSYPGWHLEDKYLSLFADLEMACAIVDNTLTPVFPNRVIDTMRDGFRKQQDVFETTWFSFKIFKNGNVKFDFKNKEIVDRLNSWGAPENMIA